MKFNSNMKAMIIFFAFLILQSCSTLPRLADVEPENYEDDLIRIEYFIGSNIYFLVVENKSDNVMVLDLDRVSVISIDGESRKLNFTSGSDHIPPRSKVVYQSNDDAFFTTDIDAFFTRDIDAFFNDRNYEHEEEEAIISSMIGNSIRLYLPIFVNEQERIFDITIEIMGLVE